MKKYIEYNGQTIKTDIYYNIGGYNTKRGYYLSVQPVEITEHKTADGQPYKIEKFMASFSCFALFLVVSQRRVK